MFVQSLGDRSVGGVQAQRGLAQFVGVKRPRSENRGWWVSLRTTDEPQRSDSEQTTRQWAGTSAETSVPLLLCFGQSEFEKQTRVKFVSRPIELRLNLIGCGKVIFIFRIFANEVLFPSVLCLVSSQNRAKNTETIFFLKLVLRCEVF